MALCAFLAYLFKLYQRTVKRCPRKMPRPLALVQATRFTVDSINSADYLLIRPLGTIVPGRSYILLLMFFNALLLSPGYLRAPQPIAVKLCHMIAIWVRFIVQVQNFGDPPPKEIGGQKHAKFGAISDNSRLRSRISPEWDKKSKIGKRIDRERFLPRSTKKVR